MYVLQTDKSNNYYDNYLYVWGIFTSPVKARDGRQTAARSLLDRDATTPLHALRGGTGGRSRRNLRVHTALLLIAICVRMGCRRLSLWGAAGIRRGF